MRTGRVARFSPSTESVTKVVDSVEGIEVPPSLKFVERRRKMPLIARNGEYPPNYPIPPHVQFTCVRCSAVNETTAAEPSQRPFLRTIDDQSQGRYMKTPGWKIDCAGCGMTNFVSVEEANRSVEIHDRGSR